MSTQTRSIRIDEDLWDQAGEAVKQNGDESITAVIRTALEQYVADTARQAPRVAKLAVQLRLRHPNEQLVELVRIIRAAIDTVPGIDDAGIVAYAGGWLGGRQ